VPREGVALALAAAFALAATPSPALADAAAGRTKAQMCTTCHGANGLAVAPNTPHLAGQPEPYLVEQLKAYRSGKRAHEVMGVVAKPLTDVDIADLAAWFAALEIVLKKEP
jgi:cytochrome c553